MICKKCGTKFSDGMFCPECGSRIIDVSGASGENLLNTWEAAFEYSDGEEYNTKIYGPQGQLEEMRIKKTIKVSAGGKEVFENKILIFENDGCIEANDNTKLEFRNCTFNLSETHASLDGSAAICVWGTNVNVSLGFENCLIKGNSNLIGGNDTPDYDSKDGTKLEFRNCAFINDRPKEEDGLHYTMHKFDPIRTYGSAYFENCFFSVTYLGSFSGKMGAGLSCGVEQNLEFRNCVIIGKAASIEKAEIGASAIIHISGEIVIDFDSCYIRSLERLVKRVELWGSSSSIYNSGKVSFKNSYLNDYSYIECKI